MEVSTRASCGAAPSKFFSSNLCPTFFHISSNFQPLPDVILLKSNFQPLMLSGLTRRAPMWTGRATMASAAPPAPLSHFLISSETSLVRSSFSIVIFLQLFISFSLSLSLYSYSIKMQKLIAKISLQATPAARQQSGDPAPSSSAPPLPLPAEWWPGGRSKRCQMYHSECSQWIMWFS